MAAEVSAADGALAQNAEIAFQLQQLAERLDTTPTVPTPQAATPAAKNLGF